MDDRVPTLRIEDKVGFVTLNRPDRGNAMHMPAWAELRRLFGVIDEDPAIRVAVLRGEGRNFCAGIDLDLLTDVAGTAGAADPCRGRSGLALRRFVLDMQDCVNAIERCRKPVVAAIQGACVGAGVDMAACCDIRIAADGAWFAVKEIDLGVVADMGVLERLPGLVGDGMARELAYTGRRFDAAEALSMRFVNRVLPDRAALDASAMSLAAELAAKSPVTLQGCKQSLLYVRDNGVQRGLEHVATWNAAMLLSEDFEEAIRALREKRPPSFRD